MHGFQISAAKQLNTAIGKERGGPRRRGTVFPDRYHAVVITSPRQARHALSEVINNWRKHGEHHEAVARTWKLDPFSSAVMFDGWKERPNTATWRTPPGYQPLIVEPPRTWLLRTGWKFHGAISYCETPSWRQDAASRGLRAATRRDTQRHVDSWERRHVTALSLYDAVPASVSPVRAGSVRGRVWRQ